MNCERVYRRKLRYWPYLLRSTRGDQQNTSSSAYESVVNPSLSLSESVSAETEAKRGGGPLAEKCGPATSANHIGAGSISGVGEEEGRHLGTENRTTTAENENQRPWPPQPGDSRNCQHGDSDMLQHGVSDSSSAKCRDSRSSEMCCPVCSKPIENSADSVAVNTHIDECLNMQSLRNLEGVTTAFDSNASQIDRKRKTCSGGSLGKSSSHTTG